MMMLLSFLFAASLTTIHLFSYKLKFLNRTPRSIWLSFAGGASVSYIFVYLIPELAEGQKLINESESGWSNYLSHHIYLVSLAGLCTFYGLERYINIVKQEHPESKVSKTDFWVHILSFSFYNCLIGYLLIQNDGKEEVDTFFFFIAMALHFLINDYGLNQHHQNLYIKKGRWILSFSILIGWAAGVGIDFPKITVLMIIAFLSGGIILNVLKEELPEDRKSNFWAFLSGVILFSFILLLG